MSETSPLDISIFDAPAPSEEEVSPGADQGRFRQLVEFMVDSPEAGSTARAEEVALALSHLRSGLLDFLSILLPLIPARESKPAEHEFAQSPEVLEL